MSGPSRWVKVLAWTGPGAGLLALLAWWGVPALLQSQLPARLSQLLGRPVTLEAVGFVPWRLALTLKGLRIGPAPGVAPADQASPPGPATAAEPLLQIAQLHAVLSLASLRQRALVVDSLLIDGLQINLARTAPGHYDIDDLLARFAPQPGAAAGEPARFALYNLALRGK